MPNPMPAIFFGHGNPMNALADNDFTKAWAAVGKALPRPKAILSVSAHWYIEETLVLTASKPRTIHDFGGFPRELYEVRYPAPGDIGLAGQVTDLLKPLQVQGSDNWGLDHGTWSVLRHVFRNADIPVVQLSIDGTQPPRYHYDLGKRLSPLRDDGILIIGSGNLVHNLHAYSWGLHTGGPFEWGQRFEDTARKLMLSRDHTPLIDYETLGGEALLSVPTPDHYLPLLYVLGLQREGEQVSFPVQGFDDGSISMLAVQIG